MVTPTTSPHLWQLHLCLFSTHAQPWALFWQQPLFWTSHQSSHQSCFPAPQKDVSLPVSILCCRNFDPCFHHTRPEWLLQQHPLWFFIQTPVCSKLLSKQWTWGDRAFSIVVTPLWSSLPKHIWDCTDLKFKSLIKSHLFRAAFNHSRFYFNNDNDKRWRNKQKLCFREIVLQTKLCLSFTSIWYKMRHQTGEYTS